MQEHKRQSKGVCKEDSNHIFRLVAIVIFVLGQRQSNRSSVLHNDAKQITETKRDMGGSIDEHKLTLNLGTRRNFEHYLINAFHQIPSDTRHWERPPDRYAAAPGIAFLEKPATQTPISRCDIVLE